MRAARCLASRWRYLESGSMSRSPTRKATAWAFFNPSRAMSMRRRQIESARRAGPAHTRQGRRDRRAVRQNDGNNRPAPNKPMKPRKPIMASVCPECVRNRPLFGARSTALLPLRAPLSSAGTRGYFFSITLSLIGTLVAATWPKSGRNEGAFWAPFGMGETAV